MRVIAGSARSLPLKTVGSGKTRPTTDRVKETLFNIIAPDIPGSRFLDLFAGSGAIGIEALSRGAAKAVFVEKDRAALKVIRENLRFTHLEERAEVICEDAVKMASSMRPDEPFDVVFMDPPYGHSLERRVLEALKGGSVIGTDTLIIIEASKDTAFSYLEELGYRILRDKSYGSNRHVFVKAATE